MKKKLLSVILAGTMMISMAGCSAMGGPGTTNNTTKAASAAAAAGSTAAAAQGTTTTAGTATTAAGKTTAAASGELTKVGFVSASWSDDYCKRLSDAIVELGPKYGLSVEAVNASPTGTVDVTGYIEALETMKQKNIKGLMVQPLFTVPDMCMEFQSKGIPTTFVNIQPQIDDTSKDLKYYYAGSYEESIGAQLAEAMAPGLKKDAKICMIELSQGQDNQIGRDKGFCDWMTANRPDVKIIAKNYTLKNDVSESVTIMEDWISKFGEDGIDGVASQSKMETQGVIESLKSHGLKGDKVCVGGISAANSDWILEGSEYCELYQNPYMEAATALNAMSKQISGKTSELEVRQGTDNYCEVKMTVMNTGNAEDYSSKNIDSTVAKVKLPGLGN